MVAATASMSRRFTELTTYVTDERQVPTTPAWTVTDVVGHVATEAGRYLSLSRGQGTWPSRVADLPAFNDHQVRDLPSRDLGELSEVLLRDTDRLLEAVTNGEASTMMFDGDQEIRADLALRTLLGELVIHGHDIATALGRAWPIDPGHVPLVLAGLHQVLPGWVDPDRDAGHTATYELRLRGHEHHIYRFADGFLEINPADVTHVDVHISADPVTQLLLNYGRIGQFRPSLTGKVTAWGRRPWLATGLRNLFLSA